MSDGAVATNGGRDRPRAPALRPERLPTAIERAAIILTAIGPELGGAFLRDIGEDDLMRFARTLSRLGRVSQGTLDAVIVEFLDALTTGPDIAGGDQSARALLGAVLEESEVTRLLGSRARKPRTVWERLNDVPIPPLASFIQGEHPQTATVILSELSPDVAANILEQLDRGFAQSIVLRLSRVPTLDLPVIAGIQGAIERDFLSALQSNLSKRRPADMIAGLMNNISSEAREIFLAYLEKQEPALAQEVLRTMFTFGDIVTRINARDISAILREVPEESLLQALKYGEAQESPTVAFILGNVPRRLAERYIEDIANMAAVSRKDGEAAHIEMTNMIQAMARRGAIKFAEAEG